MKLEQSTHKPTANITLIFGRICSGKSTFVINCGKASISASSVVKSLIDGSTRDLLQETAHLDDRIADRLVEEINNLLENAEHVYVEGIRQVSIVERILAAYPNARLIWLEVPTHIREQRYEKRSDIKDVEPFEQADNRPLELESLAILNKFRDNITIINNP